MSTAPTKIVHESITFDELIAGAVAQHRRRDTLARRLERAASALLSLAAIVALAAVIVDRTHPWVQVVVIAMLVVGLTALAALRLRIAGRHLDSAVGRLLGR